MQDWEESQEYYHDAAFEGLENAVGLESFGWGDPVGADLVSRPQSSGEEGCPPDASSNVGVAEAQSRLVGDPRLAGRVAVNRHGGVRWTGKAFFFTYSRTSLSRESVTAFFVRQRSVKRMIVGQEHHQDGSLHWHVCLEFSITKDVRNARAFDIQGEHPNVMLWTRSGGQTYEQWFLNHWEYCKKEDPTPFIVGPEPSPDDNRKRKRDETFAESMDICIAEGVKPAIEFLRRVAPYELVTKYDQIYRTMVSLRNEATQVQTPARPVSEFVHAPEVVDSWRCLYINGATYLGKTAWARSLLPEATVVRHTDQLRTVDFSKGVIFDDFDVSHWPPTAVIHLLDWDEPSGINVKHGHVVIPAQTRKIFTHNGSFEGRVS